MPVRTVIADSRIADDIDKVAIQRGPVIYCAEWPDNNQENLLSIMIDKDAVFKTEYVPGLLGGAQVIRTIGYPPKRTLEAKLEKLEAEPLTLIPYALWNNRGAGKMKVWIPVSKLATRPLPAPTIAWRSNIRASKMTKDINAVRDQVLPLKSNDRSVPYYHWWPNKNRWEWVEYDFDKPEIISKTKVYWYDDGPDGGCRIPDEWEILYLNGNIWELVKNKNRYGVTKDAWDYLEFEPVESQTIKIKVKLNREFSSGIYEWVVE
jgi:hypothetical protein